MWFCLINLFSHLKTTHNYIMSNTSSSNDDTHNSEEMCTSCEQNKNVGTCADNTSSTNIDTINLDKSSTFTDSISICANCGKDEESSGHLKFCAACKSVKYCSRECQAAHRLQHKKECRKRAAELHDEKLFKVPPPNEDCPICMIQLPVLEMGRRYMPCCGKVVCSGCVHAVQIRSKGFGLCPFCRTPTPSSSKEMLILGNK